MSEAQPYEVLAIEDREQFPTRHGTTLQAMQWSVKDKDGAVLSLGVNRRPATPPPAVGDTVWLETWETEQGFMKGKKVQGPRSTGPARFSSDGDGSRDKSIVRQHSQHMALLYAGQSGGNADLDAIKALTDHFDADVQRASGAAQGNGSPITVGTSDGAPASPRASNGEPKISEAQITNFILRKQRQVGISDENMALLVKSFGIERLRDLPRSKVDEFATAMVNPIPDGTSDIPEESEPVGTTDDGDDIPF